MWENGAVIGSINQETNIATITFGHASSNSLPGAVLQQLAEKITALP